MCLFLPQYILNAREFMREYGDILNVPARVLNTREEVTRRLQAEEERVARQQAAAEGEQLARTQQLLAQTQVGGSPLAGGAAL